MVTLDLNTWLTIVFGFVGVISLTLFLVFRERKGLHYAVIDDTIIEKVPKLLENVVILYDTNAVSSVAVTKMAIWNGGNRALDNRVLETTDPLRIATPRGAERLDASILGVTRDVFNIRFQEFDEQLLFKFDFLSPGHGCIIQVIHTSPDEETGLSLEGYLKGVKIRRRTNIGAGDSEQLSFVNRRWTNVKRFLILLFGLVYPAFFTIIFLTFTTWQLALAAVLTWSLWCYAVWGAWPKFPRRLRAIS